MKKAVVLGAYGLIGAACVRALRAAGFEVVGIGRSLAAGRRILPDIAWIARDIGRTTAKDWAGLLHDADVVVNASGALQSGARDNLGAIHETAIARLVEALQGRPVRLIQISAAGVSEAASTEFFRSKARGDRLLMASGLDHVILRPTLVIGREAYGGTALLRAAAAFPLVRPTVLAMSPIQTVALDDVAAAVVSAARGDIPGGTVADLTEPGSRRFGETVAAMRGWLGFAPWRWTVPVPDALLGLVSTAADALGWLGWRSPLRSTSIRVLREGIAGDPAPWLAAGGKPCRSLDETLATMPATAQERWFAKAYLLLPLLVAVLAAFWTASGLIGLARMEAAMAVLTDRGVSATFAAVAVVGGSLVDLALGLGILVRPLARRAALAMTAVALAYMAGAVALAPDLWADPLGPMLKTIPAAMLSLVAAAMLDER